MNYDIDRLRELIYEKHGKAQLWKANIHINSIPWKLEIAKYHELTARDVFKCFFENVENESLEVLRIMMSSEKSLEFEEAKLRAEANTIAFAQSMYTVSDLLAHLITLALKLEDLSDITLTIVHKKLPTDSTLKEKIVELLGLAEYKYLKNFVNKTKHISLVASGYKAHLKESRHGMKLNGFSHKDMTHSEKWYDDFIDEMYLIEAKYLEILNHLTIYLENK